VILNEKKRVKSASAKLHKYVYKNNTFEFAVNKYKF